MFSSISMAGTGAIITLLTTVFKILGWEFPEGTIADGVNGLVAFVGLVLLAWGQFRRSDLYMGLFRKE